MQGFFENLLWLYFGLCVLIWSLVGLVLALDKFYDMDTCLTDKKEFLRCLFQYEFFVWENTEKYLNKAGRIILLLLSIIVCLPCNLIIFAILTIEEFIRLIIWLFLKCFGKKTNKEFDIYESK